MKLTATAVFIFLILASLSVLTGLNFKQENIRGQRGPLRPLARICYRH